MLTPDSSLMRPLDPATVPALLDGVSLNLIRRGADGSLVLSRDHWQLASLANDVFTFVAEPPAPPDHEPLVIALADVETITWDRLAKQEARSQVRFRLKNGDLQTFSGRIPDPS
jgi:hypothetical protein